ncbi:MAG: AbrB family transcriptional regulator [Clostridia bacterium]
MPIARLLLTIMVGAAFGYFLYKLKVPGGVMVGSIVGVTVLNIAFNAAYMPLPAKVIAQITAGAYIGCTAKKSDIYRMKYIYKPAIILLTSYFILNMVLGLTISIISRLDFLTSFMCAIPGGISDVPLIAVDMGADASKVVVMQFVRMAAGVGVFPGLIAALNKSEQRKPGVSNTPDKNDSKYAEPKDSLLPKAILKGRRHGPFIYTAAVAFICGMLGKLMGMPSGTLLFSMLGVLIYKLFDDSAFIPIWAKRLAQVLSGAYIGCSVDYNSLLEMRYLLLPALVLLTGYLANSMITGRILHKFFGLSLKEGMLAATPAGASDMALISADIGVQSPDVIVLHIIRVIFVVAVFPQIINLVVMLLE